MHTLAGRLLLSFEGLFDFIVWSRKQYGEESEARPPLVAPRPMARSGPCSQIESNDSFFPEHTTVAERLGKSRSAGDCVPAATQWCSSSTMSQLDSDGQGTFCG